MKKLALNSSGTARVSRIFRMRYHFLLPRTKGKRSIWEAWKSFPEVASAFLFLAENSFKAVDITSPDFMTLERFTVVLYDNTSDCQYLNELRRELFCKKNRSSENLPSNQDAPAKHVKWTIFRSSIWALSSDPQCITPRSSEWGWKREENKWKKREENKWIPVGMTLSEAAKACTELIKCCCSAGPFKRCKCAKAVLDCTELCNCRCQN